MHRPQNRHHPLQPKRFPNPTLRIKELLARLQRVLLGRAVGETRRRGFQVFALVVVFAQAGGFRGGAQAAEEEDVDFGVGVAGEVAGEEEEGGEGFEEGRCWWGLGVRLGGGLVIVE